MQTLQDLQNNFVGLINKQVEVLEKIKQINKQIKDGDGLYVLYLNNLANVEPEDISARKALQEKINITLYEAEKRKFAKRLLDEQNKALMAELDTLRQHIYAERERLQRERPTIISQGTARRLPKNAFKLPRSAHNRFQHSLYGVVKNISREAAKVVDEETYQAFIRKMQTYSVTLTKFAERTARQMLTDVQRRNNNAWEEYMDRSKRLSIALKNSVQDPRYKAVFERMSREAAGLIKSLPTTAAERAVHIATKGYYEGRRPESIMRDIRETGDVTASRARLIARTELSRAATNLTQARAEYAGSEEYIWHSSHDGRVRPLHLALDQTVQRWDSPPFTDPPNHHSAPGAIFSCRCFAEPLWPADLPTEDITSEYTQAVEHFEAPHTWEDYTAEGEDIFNKYEADMLYGAMGPEKLRAELAKLTELGGAQFLLNPRGSEPAAHAAFEEASKFIPKSWLQNSQKYGPMNTGIVSRPYYCDKTNFIGTSGKTDLERKTIALHQLGHAMENSNPEIRGQVNDFFITRTTGFEPEKLISLTGDPAYGQNDVAIENKFADPYIGKLYSNDHSEILSTGLQGVFFNEYNMWLRDPEMVKFIIGLLMKG